MQHLQVASDILFGKRRPGVTITAVDAGSLGAELGLAPGDQILSVNGKKLRDFIDFTFYASSEEPLTLEVQKASGETWELHLEREESEPWGLDFEHFKPKQCGNDCIFCFCKQNPEGARASLFFQDEDARLSFLYGNYTTMTTITRQEMERIVEQRLTPQYVSVHATDYEVRARLLGITRHDDLLGKLRYFVENGIDIHAQIVLCPGINDGKHLEKTVFDLAAMSLGIVSAAIVPLGMTAHHQSRELLTPVTDEWAREIVELVEPWQKQFKKKLGTSFAFLGDEFYIRAGLPIPPQSHYGDYPQIEDGVGMVRAFCSEMERALKKRWRAQSPELRVCLATGTLFAHPLGEAAGEIGKALSMDVRAKAVENRYLGRDVTVAGLLSGIDFLEARDQFDADLLVIPAVCLSGERPWFLDSIYFDDFKEQIGMPVIEGGKSPVELLRKLAAYAPANALVR